MLNTVHKDKNDNSFQPITPSLRLCHVFLVTCFFGVSAANAQMTIFDNVEPDFQFDTGGAIIRGGAADPPLPSISVAQAFTPATDSKLHGVRIALNDLPEFSIVDLAIYSGSGIGPETLLESFGEIRWFRAPFSYPADFNSQAVVVYSEDNPTLIAGEEYYIVATANGSSSIGSWATTSDSTGFWRNTNNEGWMIQDSPLDQQLAMRVLAVPPTSLLGIPDAPTGIDRLAVEFSGGVSLFNVRFDERSFDEVYDSGSSSLPFTSDADITAAMNAAADFLQRSSAFVLGASPTYDGQENFFVYFPSNFDEEAVTKGFRFSRTPAGWTSREIDMISFARDQSFPDLSLDRHVWADFSPVAAEPAITVKTVTVTHPENAADLMHGGYGNVNYVYDIGQFEITAGQYAAFLNAVASEDTYGLYNVEMWTSETGCKIARTGSVGDYKYSVASDFRDLPVNFVSWADAARFCNWMHNGQPTGSQTASTTEDGSYLLIGATSDTDFIGVTRTIAATWVLPSEDEWYKAAYHKNDGPTANYWDYPTGTDTAPSSELPPGSDFTNGSANFFGADFAIGTPYFRTDVGSYNAWPSSSPYGTFDQGGNVFEWNEGIVFDTSRGLRGGAFYSSSDDLRSWNRSGFSPTVELDGFGIRVARLRQDKSPCLAPERLGGLYSGGYATSVATAGSTAFIANGNNGLLVVDVSDPTLPAHLSSPDMSSDAYDVEVEGDTVFVSDRELGLLIVDASIPTSPTLISSVDLEGPVFGLTKRDSVVYVAAQFNGLKIVDVDDPSMPVLLGTLDGIGFATDVEVINGVAYVTTIENGLHIADVNDPANPMLLGHLDTPGEAISVFVSDNIAYVADGEQGLKVVNVANPTTPWLIGGIATPGIAVDVVVEFATAYVAAADAGLQLIDVSAPASLEVISSFGTPGEASGIYVENTVAMIADGNFGLSIVDIDDNGLEVGCDISPCGFGRPIGDTNGDALVDLSDLPRFVSILINPEAATPEENCAADVNEDGNVDSRDVQNFINLVLAP